MTIETLVLRPVSIDDLPIFYEHQRDVLAVEMANFPSREREAFMVHWAKIMVGESGFLRTVVVDGLAAGNVVSFLMEGKREVGYWFGREFWGRGIASGALAAFLMEEVWRPLYGWTAKHNKGSQRVLLKCGFVLEAEVGEEVVFRLDGV